MGITIEEAKMQLSMQKFYKLGKDYEAVQVAIETMRKYQKIEQIVKQEDYDRFNSHNYYGDFLRVQDIRKVLEDGNN